MSYTKRFLCVETWRTHSGQARWPLTTWRMAWPVATMRCWQKLKWPVELQHWPEFGTTKVARGKMADNVGGNLCQNICCDGKPICLHTEAPGCCECYETAAFVHLFSSAQKVRPHPHGVPCWRPMLKGCRFFSDALANPLALRTKWATPGWAVLAMLEAMPSLGFIMPAVSPLATLVALLLCLGNESSTCPHCSW